jgi:DNA repair exonuclease SbcCD nuclease subunit
LLIADPHIGLWSSSDVWHNTAIRLFQSIADVGIKRNIKKVIILGDFFDERKFLSIKTLDVALTIAKILDIFDVFFIIGNHDAFYKDRILPTSLGIFSKHPNIIIIDEPYELNDMFLVPWGTKPSIEWYKYRVILGHFEINGFPANDHYIFRSPLSLNVDDFENCNWILSGHFHQPARKENIRYLGSPYHMSFGDTTGSRGFYVLEGTRLELIEFREAPKFVKVHSGDQITEEMIKGNIVKLIYSKDYGKIQNNKILEAIQFLKPLQLHTDFARIPDDMAKERSEETVHLKNNKEILYDFISKSKLPAHIKEKTLKNVIDNLLRDSTEDE